MHARLLIDPPQNAACNMAVDEALLRLCSTPILRFYEWEGSVVSIGYFQSCRVVEKKRKFIRRYTGGGLVDHANDLTYSIILPLSHPVYAMGTALSYQKIHEKIAHTFEKLGITSAKLAADSQKEEHPACFQRPVRFDLVDDTGQKLAGAAQRRIREGCLHQGSILLPFKKWDRKVWQTALAESILPLLGEEISLSELKAEEISLANELEKTRYSTHEWNHQR